MKMMVGHVSMNEQQHDQRHYSATKWLPHWQAKPSYNERL